MNEKIIKISSDGTYVRVKSTNENLTGPDKLSCYREFISDYDPSFVSVVYDKQVNEVSFKLSDGERKTSINFYLGAGNHIFKIGEEPKWDQESVEEITKKYKLLKGAVEFLGEMLGELINDERDSFLMVKKFLEEKKREEKKNEED